MKKTTLTLLLLLPAILPVSAAAPESPSGVHYPISPVPFTAVRVNDAFWSPRLQTNRDVTITIAFHQSEITNRIKNFWMAAHPSKDNKPTGIFYDDSDVYKIIEGAAYSLQSFPDPKLEHYVDSVIDLIAAAQEPDGYLYTFRTMNPLLNTTSMVKPERWAMVEQGSHELYNQGHMMEAAVAYFQATGKRKLLDVAVKSADCICRAIGPGENQLKIVPGHEEIELALCKLYLVTGDHKYLDEAKFFIDMRGRTKIRGENTQSDKPITEQTEASGHAVRACYLYSGIADVAALTGEKQYVDIIDRIWNDIVEHRLYLIGGIGSSRSGEAFGPHYDLPNETAYNETCAAIALSFLNERLFLLHGQSKYIDVLERTLYNGILSGLAVSGDRFFYPNPLASHGGYGRSEWFGTACCPSNLCRFIPSVPGYVFAVRDRKVYVNLFMSCTADVEVENRTVQLSQQTGYPWNGDIDVTIGKNSAGRFALALRIPGWVQSHPLPSDLYRYDDGLTPAYSVSVNGQPVSSELTDGYFVIDRKWKKGDRIRLHFDMPVRTVKARPEVKADLGQVAFERGPIVYCAEDADNRDGVFSFVVSTTSKPETFTARLLSPEKIKMPLPKAGTAGAQATQTLIRLDAQQLSYAKGGPVETTTKTLTLIPYHLWDQRVVDAMKVWLPQTAGAVEPAPSK